VLIVAAQERKAGEIEADLYRLRQVRDDLSSATSSPRCRNAYLCPRCRRLITQALLERLLGHFPDKGSLPVVVAWGSLPVTKDGPECGRTLHKALQRALQQLKKLVQRETGQFGDLPTGVWLCCPRPSAALAGEGSTSRLQIDLDVAFLAPLLGDNSGTLDQVVTNPAPSTGNVSCVQIDLTAGDIHGLMNAVDGGEADCCPAELRPLISLLKFPDLLPLGTLDRWQAYVQALLNQPLYNFVGEWRPKERSGTPQIAGPGVTTLAALA
jgi:hypothetical protein